jgi:hypothetical protein
MYKTLQEVMQQRPMAISLSAAALAWGKINARHLHIDAEQLVPLTGLSGLRTLIVTLPDAARHDFSHSVCQLTELRELNLDASPDVEAEG